MTAADTRFVCTLAYTATSGTQDVMNAMHAVMMVAIAGGSPSGGSGQGE
jgi:hypothetical protein